MPSSNDPALQFLFSASTARESSETVMPLRASSAGSKRTSIRLSLPPNTFEVPTPATLSSLVRITLSAKSWYRFMSAWFPGRGFRMNHAMAPAAGSTVVMTGLFTSSGYSATCSRRFDTLTSLESRSVPAPNSRVTVPTPSWLSLLISERPATDLSSSSCSFTTSLSTSKGLAPLHEVVTVIFRLSTSGVSCTGILKKEMRPKMKMNIMPTRTVTGFFMEDSTSFMVRLF